MAHRGAGLADGGGLAADHERLHLAHQVVHLRHHQLAPQYRLSQQVEGNLK